MWLKLQVYMLNPFLKKFVFNSIEIILQFILKPLNTEITTSSIDRKQFNKQN